MKKMLVFISAILFIGAIVATASAVPIQVTYTADNIVNAWFQDGAAPVALTLGANASIWQNADTETLDLDVGHQYQIIWQAENEETLNNPNNWPGGFLAQIIGPELEVSWESTPVEKILTSANWYVAHTGDLSAIPVNEFIE